MIESINVLKGVPGKPEEKFSENKTFHQLFLHLPIEFVAYPRSYTLKVVEHHLNLLTFNNRGLNKKAQSQCLFEKPLPLQ